MGLLCDTSSIRLIHKAVLVVELSQEKEQRYNSRVHFCWDNKLNLMREVDGEFIISLTQTQTERKPGNISPCVSAIFIQTGESNGARTFPHVAVVPQVSTFLRVKTLSCSHDKIVIIINNIYEATPL